METVLQTYIGFQLIIKKLGQKLGQVQFAFTLLNLFELNHFEHQIRPFDVSDF
tara:strand:+ start:9408 stop:9566 length:159 start_codon:yes stop_codon:yes gene_type:complete